MLFNVISDSYTLKSFIHDNLPFLGMVQGRFYRVARANGSTRKKSIFILTVFVSDENHTKKQICVHIGSDEYWKTLLRDWNLTAWPKIKACAYYLKLFSSLPGRFRASAIRFWCKSSLFTGVTPSFQPSKSDPSHVSMHKYYASA